MTFDVNKPLKFKHCIELAAHVSKLRPWKFFFIFLYVLRSKLVSFFYHFLIVYQVSCHFAAVETDAKNVTGRIAAWNNRTKITSV